MLQVSLHHRFGQDGFALAADFAMPGDGVTALFGPSGCGKTTILSAVAGLLRPLQGRIVLDGRTLLDTARGIALPPEARRCAVVFQDARLFPHLSVESNLRYGLRRAPRDATGPDLPDVVALLGLEALLHRRPAGLSGGEKQRVALGRALLSRPLLLLMDEPLAALDAPRRAEVLPFLSRMRQAARLPILYVTHQLDEVDAMADRLVLLQDGKILAEGAVEEIAARTDLPLAARRDGGVLLGCTIADHDATRGFTRLAFAGGDLLTPLRAEPLGMALRIRIRARDVAIATEPPQGVSVNNVLPCTLAGIDPTGAPHEVFLRLAVGPTTILARVARDTVARLTLRPGMVLWALVKSVAFDHAIVPPLRASDLR